MGHFAAVIVISLASTIFAESTEECARNEHGDCEEVEHTTQYQGPPRNLNHVSFCTPVVFSVRAEMDIL